MILHSFDYPPMHGGISRLCAEIAAGYARRGVDVRTLTQTAPHDGGSLVPRLPETRVTPRRPRREWAAWQALLRAVRGEAVVCGIWYPEGLLATLARVRPRVILAHGSELMPPPQAWRRGVWRRMQHRVLSSADLVIADSDYTRRLVLDVAPGSRVVSVPLAVDHQRFSPGDRDAARRAFGVSDKRVLSSVSRLWSYKGHDVVFSALARLPEPVREQFAYLVAGRGPDRDRMEQEARDLGVAHLVRWLGYVAEDDLPDLYRASDLFVLCTRETPRQEVEGFGLVFLEAQACGTPTVGTRSGGIPDAVAHGDGGWLIEEDDADSLAGILRQLADDPASIRRAGEAARARVERTYTWDHYLERFHAALAAGGISLG